MRAAPGDRHVQALQRPQEPSHVQQHPRVSYWHFQRYSSVLRPLLDVSNVIEDHRVGGLALLYHIRLDSAPFS